MVIVLKVSIKQRGSVTTLVHIGFWVHRLMRNHFYNLCYKFLKFSAVCCVASKTACSYPFLLASKSVHVWNGFIRKIIALFQIWKIINNNTNSINSNLLDNSSELHTSLWDKQLVILCHFSSELHVHTEWSKQCTGLYACIWGRQNEKICGKVMYYKNID